MPGTPYHPNASPCCEGVIVCVGNADTSPADAETIALRLAAEIRGEWQVCRLGRNSRDFLVHRPLGGEVSTALAWDLVYQLRSHRDVEDCEPSLMLPVDGPPALRETANLASSSASVSASSSSGGDNHLSCSADREWALQMCEVRGAWELPRPPGGEAQGRGIVVGHPDTGYTRHPQIFDPERLLADEGFDFEDSDDDPLDPLVGFSGGHGTSTSSVIMSGVDEATSVVTGIAPLAKLIPLRVTTSVVLFGFRRLTQAINAAADARHEVISISLGGPLRSGALRRAIQAAVDSGAIVLAAAGNVWPFVVYPARFDEVIAVAACNCQRNPWRSSASGAPVDITAPGESVWRALAQDDGGFTSGRSSGTSFSVAITAGAASLWLAHHDRRKLINRYGARNLAAVFKELLVTQGFDRPPDWDTGNFGAGILNARKLLEAPLPETAAARGMAAFRASPVPRSTSPMDDLASYFPLVEPARIRSVICDFLQVDENALNRVLSDYGDELAYHITTGPQVYAHLTRGCFETTKSARAQQLKAACGLVEATASEHLRSQIQ